MSRSLKLIFLGTGAAIPPIGRYQVSFALVHEHGTIIFDCGEGTQYRIRENKVSLRKELIICLSHLHSDHFLGIPGLLASLQLLSREEIVTIIGPPGTQIVVENLLKVNFVHIIFPLKFIEMNNLDSFEGKGYTIIAHDAIHEANAKSFLWIEDEKPGNVDLVKAETFGIPIGPELGKLQSNQSIIINGKEIQPSDIIGPPKKGRTIAYSGDTALNKEFLQKIRACDMLIHEATYPSSMADLAIQRNHTTIKQIIDVYRSYEIGEVVLTHLSQRFNEYDEELKKYDKLDGVSVAFEGMIIDLDHR